MSTTDLAANMRRTSDALVMSFNGKWTTEASLAPRAPECEHIMLPDSLGIPKKNNAEWAARFEHVKDLIEDAEMTINDYVGVPEERRAVCRSSMDAKTPVGLFHNEYIWFFDFNETGDKIVKITEFMDTEAVKNFRSMLIKAGLREDPR